MGCDLDEEGYVRTDETLATSVPFAHAAGDCAGSLKQVSQATAEGERAAVGLCSAARGGRAGAEALTPYTPVKV